MRINLQPAREVNDGRDGPQTLLGRHGGVVRGGCVESPIGEREELCETTEDGGQDEVEDGLGEDTPCEDDQNTWIPLHTIGYTYLI